MKASVSKAQAFSAFFTDCCGACEGQVKSVRREFSDQAWSALVTWKELERKSVDLPLCNDCYFNFRDVLIERADELKLLATNAKVAAARAHEQANRARA
jgi:hypothetical protein